MVVYTASFQLPTLPAGNDASRPDWILLDTMGYISDCQNATKAEAYTSTQKKVRVSFFVAEPPAVSHFSVYCPDLRKEDFVREPHVVQSEARSRTSLSSPSHSRALEEPITSSTGQGRGTRRRSI
jgi:hypothetical protein